MACTAVADGAQAAQALIDKMTERSRAALHGMSRLSDCTVETADGLVFSLHKSVLGEASIVLRYAYVSSATTASIRSLDGLLP